MYSRTNQAGQATVELIVSLIGILAVFCGFLLISKLGIQNVDNIIRSRGVADNNAITSVLADPGTPTLSWNSGPDNIPYTADDVRISGTFADPAMFSDELQNGLFSLKNDFSMSYVHENFAPNAGNPDFIFLAAAELTSGSASSSVQLDDLDRLLYVDSPRISLRDESFSPFINDN